jgi:hypothetical protein
MPKLGKPFARKIFQRPRKRFCPKALQRDIFNSFSQNVRRKTCAKGV